MYNIVHSRKTLTLMVVFICLTLASLGSKIDMVKLAQVFNVEISSGDTINRYTIKANLSPDEKLITASETVIYVNNTGIELDAVYFHLYPNAFKSEKYLPFNQGNIDLAYPHGFEPGYINVHRVANAKEPLNYVTMGLGDCILKVHLNDKLDIGEEVELNIDFEVKIPPCQGRFGHGEKTINLGNWYPIVSVFNGKGWNLEPYHSMGDPFYSDIGNYRVEISLPGEYIIASTGEVIKKEDIEGKVLWTIEGRMVRDFSMLVSNEYKILTEEVKGVKIYSYYLNDSFGEISLETAKDSISIFSQLFGEYPYKQFSVAASDFFVGGMEYPNLVFIDNTLYCQSNTELLEYVIAHEAAHQWWYGVVGNDQVHEPWLDEALTEYSTILYYESKYGAEKANEVYSNRIEKYYNAYLNSGGDVNGKVYRSLKEFENSLEYQMMVYFKGAMFVGELRNTLGDEKFFQVMKVYFDKYKYKNATTDNFLEICEKVSNQELDKLFENWIGYKKE